MRLRKVAFERPVPRGIGVNPRTFARKKECDGCGKAITRNENDEQGESDAGRMMNQIISRVCDKAVCLDYAVCSDHRQRHNDSNHSAQSTADHDLRSLP